MPTHRRTFLKVGALAALALAAGGGIYRLARGPVAAQRFAPDAATRTVLAALIPAMLDGVLPREAAARAAAIGATGVRVEQAILGLPLATQKEVQDLFGLLALAPARRLLAGLPEAWPEASVLQVSAFLQHWRLHRFALPQVAYHALHDLIIGGWYADASSWAAISYPGPIPELS
jgi:hypothetical protein